MVLRFALAFLVAGIACLLGPGTAGAQQIPPPPYRFFPDDATPAPGTNVDQNAIVGFASVNNGMFETPSSPTLTIGDDVDFRGNTYLYNSSTLNLNGFSSLLSLYPNDNATANLNSGFLFEVRA